MRSLRFEPGAVARHASDLAGHCQRCPDGFYRRNCDGGGSSSESTVVENTNNGDTEKQDSVETDENAPEVDSLSDDTEAKGAEQPADNSANGENAIALAGEIVNGYTTIQGDVTNTLRSGGKYCLTGDACSTTPIKIEQDTTINLAGHKLYYHTGKDDTFITVTSGVLTIEDTAEAVDESSTVIKNPGEPATMAWTGDNNGTPQSLTYYETTSTPHEDKLGTTETTTEHVVSGFGAIVAASEGGSVKRVISVAKDCTLNLNGGMITTPQTLGNDGHVFFSGRCLYFWRLRHQRQRRWLGRWSVHNGRECHPRNDRRRGRGKQGSFWRWHLC